jgi:hypothetical protein
MKLAIALAATLSVATSFLTSSTQEASARVYCTYVGYPAGCIVRSGVVLRPRPVARAAVRGGTVNRGGPVNRRGRR